MAKSDKIRPCVHVYSSQCPDYLGQYCFISLWYVSFAWPKCWKCCS